MGCTASRPPPPPPNVPQRQDQITGDAISATLAPVATPALDGFTLRGVSLHYMQQLRSQARKRQAVAGPRTKAGGRRRKGDPLTTADVCMELVRPQTAKRRVAHVELEAVAAEVGQADVFVVHAWQYDFEWLVGGLEVAAMPAETRFWIDFAVVNQHNSTRSSKWWAKILREVIKSVSTTLLVLAKGKLPVERLIEPVPLRRVWCLWEIFCTVDNGSALRVVLPPTEREEFVFRALQQDHRASDKAAAAIDVRKAESFDPADRQAFLSAIKAACGYHALNVAVADALRGGLMRTAQEVLANRWPTGKEAPDMTVVQLAGHVALLLEQRGKTEEARALFQRVLERQEKARGMRHPDRLRAVKRLARIFELEGRYDEARPLLQGVLNIEEQELGWGHSETLRTVTLLAGVMARLSKDEEARPLDSREQQLGRARLLYQRALDGQEKALGGWHPETLIAVLCLAGFFMWQGKYTAAWPLVQRAVAGSTKPRYPEPPPRKIRRFQEAFATLTLGSLSLRGELLRRSGCTPVPDPGADLLEAVSGGVRQAEADLRQALSGQQTARGNRHRLTLSAMASLSLLLAQQGRMKEAAAVYANVPQGEPLGPQVPETKANVAELCRLLDERGDDGGAAFRAAAQQLRERFGCE